jgi:DNA-binding GntR family transcriptional regulator
MPAKSVQRGLRNQLIDRLRADVMSGMYREGDAIRQAEVVSRYGVSRTPVREAMIQLVHEGLFTAIPNCGVRVATLPPDSIQEFLIPIRRVIEVYALRLCFDSLDEDDFVRWRGILDGMRLACERLDHSAIVESDIAFHRSIIERAGEPSLVAIWSTIVGQVHVYFRRSLLKYDDLMDVYREHDAIIQKFRQGDIQAAMEFLGSLIGNPENALAFLHLHGVLQTKPDENAKPIDS